MAEKSMWVKIGADVSEFKAGLQKVQGYIEEHQKQFRQIGAVVTAVGVGMTAFFKSAVDSAAAQEVANQKLINALKNVPGATEEGTQALIRQAGALQGLTGYQDEEIINAQAMLATFQLTDAEIAQITPRLLDMAAATEKASGQKADLQSIAVALGKGFTGLAGSLTRYGVVLSEEAKKNGDFNLILRDLDANFKGASETVGKTFTGQVRILTAQFDDMKEAIGSRLIPVLLPLIQKIAEGVKKFTEWIDKHQDLLKLLIPLAAGFGVLASVLGPILIALPSIAKGAVMMAAAFNPLTIAIGAVTAAAAVGIVTWIQLKNAKEEARKASERLAEAQGNLQAKLWEAAQRAGLTKEQFDELTKKYQGNVAAMAFAIQRGKEGMEIQKALAEVGREHSKAIEEQRAALQKQNQELVNNLRDQKQTEEQLKAIATLRQQLTDEIKKASLSDVEYQRWSLQTQYQERVKQIHEEIKDESSKNELLLKARQAYHAQLAALEKSQREKELNERIAFATKIVEEEQQMALQRIEAETNYLNIRQGITDKINQMTMSEQQYKLWALQQELQAETEKITQSTTLNQQQKESLLDLWQEYYNQKLMLFQVESDVWKQIVGKTAQEIETVLASFVDSTLTAFQQWGEKGGSIFQAFGNAFRSMANSVIGALKEIVVEMMKSAIKTIAAKRAEAIASVIASVMSKIPFPINLAVVGGAIAAVSKLFSLIKLAEGGIVTRPTLAVVGERGPEAIIPLNQYGRAIGAGAGGVSMTVNFYGDINNAGDLDEISSRLADKLNQVIKGGRL